MKSKSTSILIIALIVLQIISILQIQNLRSDMNYNIRNISSEISYLNEEISRIYSNIDNQLKQEASIIQSADYSIGKIDLNEMTVNVTFKVTPKDLTEDTKIFYDISGEIHEALVRDNNSFSLSLPISITDTVYPTVIVENDGLQQLEDLEMRIDIFDYTLPQLLYPRFSGNASFSSSASTLTMNGDVIFDVKPSAINNIINSAEYIVKVDDEIVSTTALTELYTGYFEIIIDDTIQASNGQIITCHVVAVDSLGFTHEHLVYHYDVGSNAQREPHFDYRKIFSPTGELIYNINENSYEKAN